MLIPSWVKDSATGVGVDPLDVSPQPHSGAHLDLKVQTVPGGC